VLADSEDITPGKSVKIAAASLINLLHQARKRPDRSLGTSFITSLRLVNLELRRSYLPLRPTIDDKAFIIINIDRTLGLLPNVAIFADGGIEFSPALKTDIGRS